ncbi:MAG: isochorismatase family protein [Deltaproteobacteria bacterium]|nr:isochorismatase family protein [Deltaproteobacteria bacterium]
MEDLELFPERVGICIVDSQEKLAETMPEKVLKGTLRNCLNLIEAARVLDLPAVVSEQTPQALGSTLPVVAEAVLRLPRERVFFFEKSQFSCGNLGPFESWLKRCGRTQWLIAGMETHVSVYQTVRSLLAGGHSVHVPRDAVISRTMANWEIGLRLIERSGGVVSSTETAIFDLLKSSGSESFSILSRLIK